MRVSRGGSERRKKTKIDFNLDLGLERGWVASMKPFRYCGRELCGNEPAGILSIRHTSPLISGRNHRSNTRPSSHLRRRTRRRRRWSSRRRKTRRRRRKSEGRREVDIFHLFSKADPLSNLCGLRLLDRLIHYGWFSLDCRYMVELRAVQRRRKEQRDKIWIAKIPFLPDKPRPFYRFLNRRRKKARPRDYLESKLVADSQLFGNKTRVMHVIGPETRAKFY